LIQEKRRLNACTNNHAFGIKPSGLHIQYLPFESEENMKHLLVKRGETVIGKRHVKLNIALMAYA